LNFDLADFGHIFSVGSDWWMVWKML
jgi:hypothetical protein